MPVIGSPRVASSQKPAQKRAWDILRSRRQIVVAGADRRFLRVAAFFLARRGHDVTTTADAEQALDLVGLHDADVAIVDGSTTPAAALELVDEIETHYPSVTTFVVADEPDDTEPPRVRGKWKVIRRLPEDVERAPSSLAARGGRRS